ncbi:MAG: RNA polymerase sigma factor [Kofleriaceae bacterium]
MSVDVVAPTASASSTRAAEAALVEQAVTGDRTAQRAIFDQQRANVHRTLFRILGSNRDMEDLVQDTFIEVFRSLASFRRESTLRRWCGTIATRTAWRYLERRRTPVSTSGADEVVSDQVGVDRRLDAVDAVARFYAALERMPPKLRVTFALVQVDGRSLAEVAELTGVSATAVKTRMWRARAELARRARRDPVLAAYLRGDDATLEEGER